MGRCYSMDSNTIAVLQDKETVMRLIDADAFVKYLENEIRLMEEDGANPYALMIAGGAINDVGRQPTIETKQIKYFDEDEKVWKIGAVIIDSEEG